MQKSTKSKNLLLLFLVVWKMSFLNAQTISTTSTFLNTSGSGAVTFNLENTNSYPILIQDIKGVTGVSGTVAVEFYYKTTPVSGAPGAISSANGWNLVSSGSITGILNTTTTTTQPFFTGLNFLIPANTTYGIVVYATSQRYFPITTTGTTTFSQGGVNMHTGTNISYGGGIPPAAPTNHPRGWIGEITFNPALACAGTPTSGNSIASQTYACSSQAFNLSLVNDSVRLGLSYQWLSSTAGINGPYTVMANDTTRTLSKSQTTTTWYRCLVSCGGSSGADTSTAVMVKTSTLPLSGNLTVNALQPLSATNFKSLKDLALELNCVGVSGPLVIDIDTITESQPINFGAITGTSITDNITINGKNKWLTTTSSPIISFNGTQYLTIDSLNIIGGLNFSGIGVQIGGISKYITIKNSTINVGTTSTGTSNAGIAVSNSNTSATTAGNNAQYLTIHNNTIIGGYYGITLMGNTGYLDNYGHQISKNRIRDFYFYGIYLVNADTCSILNNDINRATRTTLSTFYGAYLATSRNINFDGNKIHSAGTGTYTAYPIYLSNCVSSAGFENKFTNNLIYNINTTGIFYGIYSLTTALTGAKFLHNTFNHDITSSTGAIRGAFFSVATSNVSFFNNIVNIKGSGTGIKTNLYFTTASTGFTSNYNNLLNTATGGTNLIGYWAANQITLANWRTASGQDLNSNSIDPTYLNPSAGVFLPTNALADNLGTPQGVLTDIDGNSRSTTTPDVGAYEFGFLTCSGTPIPGNAKSNLDTACASQTFTLSLINDTLRGGLTYQWLKSSTGMSGSYSPILNDTNRITNESISSTSWFRCVVTCANGGVSDTSTPVRVVLRSLPMSGTYTVNSALPATSTNYQSLSDLVNYLSCAGVSGPVVINLINVTGNQNLNFGIIAGASSTNTITINGRNNTITSGISPIVTFSGTKFVTIDSLNIIGATGYAGFGVHIGFGSEKITIKNSLIDVGATSTSTANAGVVVSGSQTAATTAGANAQYITLENNTIIGGYYGISVIGETSLAYSRGHVIKNNKVTNFYLYGIYIANSDSSFVEYNDVNRISRATVSTLYGIYSSLANNIKFRNNKIHDAGVGTYTAYPIYIANTVNATGFETEFINNTIYNINTTGTFYGIYSLTTSLNGVNFYHNTVSHNVASSTGTIRGAFFSVAINNVNFKNNIINIDGSGSGTKHCVYVTTPSSTFYSNNNVLYMGATGGTNAIGYWTANQTNLGNWTTVSLQDSNSVSSNPVFTNPTVGNLTPISSNVDNIGSPVGVLIDIEGNPRSSSTPDIGAYEFTGLAADIGLTDASLSRSSACYSSNDTAKFTITNFIGSTVNFSINPLTIVYQVNGPINTIDSVVINSDTLTIGASKTIAISSINALTPGTYSLNAFIRPNLSNSSALNDTLKNASTMKVDKLLSVSPKTATVSSPSATAVFTASSPIAPGDSVFFSEIAHYKVATGAPVAGWPAYLLADDYVELTGVPNSSIAGYTMEEWTGTTLQHSVTFPSGTIFSPAGTMILATGQLGSSVASPANFYYHTGNTVTHSSTGDNRGYVIKNPSGIIIDATVYGTYTFPAISGVTASIWSGNTPAVSSSGNRLNAPDNNTASCWVNSGTTPQNPNALNGGITLPAPTAVSGFTWYYLGSPISSDFKLTVGPYTTPGTYTYIAEYNNACGIFYDTVVVTATSTVPVKLVKFSGIKSGNDVALNWITANEINNSHFDVQFSTNQKQFTTIGKVKGNGNSNLTLKYGFIHNEALANTQAKTLFYRLAQVDFDGKINYSNTIAIDNHSINNEKLVVYPNPSNGQFRITTANKLNGNITVVNSIGKVVWSSSFTTDESEENYDFELNIPNGVYTLVIDQNQEKTTSKLVIQK